MKTCNKCGETKPIDKFHRHPQMPDGRLKQCRKCRNAWLREYRKSLPGSARQKRQIGPASAAAQNARRRAQIRDQLCDCCKPATFRKIYEFARIVGMEVDHIIPLAKGGAHCETNLQLLLPEHNRMKSDNYVSN